jgi:hypothetical protein
MTKEKMDIAIPKICNWKRTSLCNQWLVPRENKEDSFYVGNPTEDLNAMHEAEKFLLIGFEDDPEGCEKWSDYITNVIITCKAYLSNHATAYQKAEAFIMTMNLNEEQEK